MDSVHYLNSQPFNKRPMLFYATWMSVMSTAVYDDNGVKWMMYKLFVYVYIIL